MRIGQLARRTGLTIDSIRHYMDIGLLIPLKKGSQYLFEEKSVEELLLIQQLKLCGFSLSEISRIFAVRRISHLVDQQDIQELVQLYDEKLMELAFRKQQLEESRQTLQAERNRLLQNTQRSYEETGVPVSMLDLLACPVCGESLQLSSVAMNHRYLFAGNMDCSCGYHAEIRDGILIGPSENQSPYDRPDLNRELYTDIPAQLITLFQKAYNGMLENLSDTVRPGSVVLETHLNAYCFVHSQIRHLNPAARYILTDKFPEMLTLYKAKIDRLNLGLDILYIADDCHQMPLKAGCVNVFIDFFGSNEHNFYHHSPLLSLLKPLFSPGAALSGTYFSFNPMSRSIQQLIAEYPEATDLNFSRFHYEEAVRQSGFTIRIQDPVGVVTESGDNLAFSFHCSGEKMALTRYWAVQEQSSSESEA